MTVNHYRAASIAPLLGYKVYRIGLVYTGRGWPAFQVVEVKALREASALSTAAGILKPNHLQTLTVLGVE